MEHLKSLESPCALAYGFQPNEIDNVDVWIQQKVAEGLVVGRWKSGFELHVDPSKHQELLEVWKESGLDAGAVTKVEHIENFWQAMDFFSEGNIDAFTTKNWCVEFSAKNREIILKMGETIEKIQKDFNVDENDPSGLENALKGQKIDVPDFSADVGKDPFLLNQYGKMLSYCHVFAMAGEYFRRAVEAMPQFSEPYSNLGTLLWKLGNRREAFLLFIESFLKNPHRPASQLNLFDSGHELEEYESMGKVIEEVLPYTPEYPEFRHHLALCYINAGRFDEGKSVLRGILAQNPTDEDAQNLLVSLDKEMKLSEGTL